MGLCVCKCLAWLDGQPWSHSARDQPLASRPLETCLRGLIVLQIRLALLHVSARGRRHAGHQSVANLAGVRLVGACGGWGVRKAVEAVLVAARSGVCGAAEAGDGGSARARGDRHGWGGTPPVPSAVSLSPLSADSKDWSSGPSSRSRASKAPASGLASPLSYCFSLALRRAYTRFSLGRMPGYDTWQGVGGSVRTARARRPIVAYANRHCSPAGDRPGAMARVVRRGTVCAPLDLRRQPRPYPGGRA